MKETRQINPELIGTENIRIVPMALIPSNRRGVLGWELGKEEFKNTHRYSAAYISPTPKHTLLLFFYFFIIGRST